MPNDELNQILNMFGPQQQGQGTNELDYILGIQDWSGGYQQQSAYDPNYREQEFGSSGYLPGSRALGMGQGEGEAYYGPEQYEGIETDIENWWNAKVSRVNAPAYVKKADGTYEQQDPSAVNVASRTIGEGIGAIMDVLQLPAKGVKAYLGATEALENIADASASSLPDLNTGDAWYNQVLNALPPYAVYNAMRAMNGSRQLTQDEMLKQLDSSVQASRIAYSAWVDPALRAEFKRRYEAGENPIYLENELMNPWHEMAGEFVLDPLNFVDWLGKGAAATKKYADVASRFAQAAPEASKLTDAIRAATYGGQVAQDFDIASETAKVAEAVKNVEQGIKRLDGYGNFAVRPLYTATARRSFIGETVGNVGRVILGAYQKSPDEAAEVIRAMIKVGSGNADEIREAAEILGKTSTADVSRLVFSQAGMETSVMLRKMMSGADGALDETGFLNALKDADPKKIDDIFNRKLDTALADLFPTVDQQVAKNAKIEEQAKALQAAGKVDDAAALRKTISPISPGAKAVNDLHNFAQKNLKMKAVHDAMSTVYISLNPGVGVKNVLGGLTHIAADMGVGTAYKAAGESAKALGAVTTGKSLEESIGSYKLIREWMGGKDIAAASRGVSGMFEDVKDPLKIGDAMTATEKAMSAAIVADSLESTMRRALKASFKELAPMLEKTPGMGQDGAKMLMAKVEQYKGDWTKAIADYRAQKARGYIESWRNIKEWMSPDEYKRLESAKLLNQVEKAVQTDDIDKAFGKLDEIVNGYKRLAAGAVDDTPGPVTDELIMAAKGYVPDKEITTLDLKRIAYENARNAVIKSATDYLTFAQNNGADPNAILALSNQLARFTGEGGPAQRTVALTRRMNTMAWNAYEQVKKGDFAEAWKSLTQDSETWKRYESALKLPKTMPTDAKEFKDLIWKKFYFGGTDLAWMQQRDEVANFSRNIAEQAGALINQAPEQVLSSDIMRPAISKLSLSDKIANAEYIPGKGLIPKDGTKSAKNSLRELANKLGIHTATQTADGKPVQMENFIMNVLNKYKTGDEAQKWEKLTDVPLEEGRKALLKYAKEKGIDTSGISAVEKLPIVRPDDSDELFTSAQVASANLDGVANQISRVKEQLRQVWGKGTPVARLTSEEEKALAQIAKIGNTHVAEARAVGAEIASQARDFALVNYSRKTYLDVAAAYLMPYAFWYSRTYPNWLKRVVSSPSTIAAYAKYKEYLGKAHANLPDWWKYNLSTNDLPGVDSENPFFFNLEATLNPMNGLTGVDFTDPEKVVGDEGSAMRMWTGALDSMGKFGPAPHTLLTLGTAYALYMQNEKDAASRWAGRVIPQTASLKALTSYFGRPLEVDPGVVLMSGGVDPYEARRIGRALGEMIQENPAIEAQALEAARTRSGPLWEQAYQRATQARAPMTLQSFFLGTGFKGRTSEDMRIDQFYTDYRNLWAQKDNLKDWEFAQAMNELKKEYPFMETLLLSKKDGIDRDRGYAYAVMGRIPPGSMSDMTKAVGLDPRLLEKFYDSKGAIDQWSETERQKFMMAMVDIGATLDVPTDATRAEWTRVRQEYARMNDIAKQQFGSDIMDKLQIYYDIDDLRVKDGYSKLHPEIQQFLDWKAQYIPNNSLLSIYYDGVGQYEKYYDGKLRAEVTKLLGADFYDVLDEYYRLRDTADIGEKAFYKAHPEIKRYYDLKDKWDMELAKKLAAFGSILPEGQTARLRNLETFESMGSEDLAQYIQGQQNQPTWQDIAPSVPADLQQTIASYFDGRDIPYSQEARLKRLAKYLGMDMEQLLIIAAQGLQ